MKLYTHTGNSFVFRHFKVPDQEILKGHSGGGRKYVNWAIFSFTEVKIEGPEGF